MLLQANSPWTLQPTAVGWQQAAGGHQPGSCSAMPLELLQQHAAQSGLQLSPMRFPLEQVQQSWQLRQGYQQQHRQQMAGDWLPFSQQSSPAPGAHALMSPPAHGTAAAGRQPELGVSTSPQDNAQSDSLSNQHAEPGSGSPAQPQQPAVAWIVPADGQADHTGSQQAATQPASQAQSQGDDLPQRRSLQPDSTGSVGDLVQEHFELQEPSVQATATAAEQEAPPAGPDLAWQSSNGRHADNSAELLASPRQTRALARTLTQTTGGCQGARASPCAVL